LLSHIESERAQVRPALRIRSTIDVTFSPDVPDPAHPDPTLDMAVVEAKVDELEGNRASTNVARALHAQQNALPHELRAGISQRPRARALRGRGG
jgi:hypothetical protein